LGPVDSYHHFPLETVARDISDNKLLACSDGAFDSTQGTGTFGWVLATQDKQIRFRCAGPVNGHQSFTSAYRAELSGLLAVLYIIGRVCDYLQVTDGSLYLYCDNKSAIKNVFKNDYRSLTGCLATDYDIICQAKIILHQLPIKVKAEWVKGHSTAKTKSTPEEINIIADQLAASYADCNPLLYRPSRLPLPPPKYAVRILFDGSVITSKLYKILSNSLHTATFIAHIMKKSKWPHRIFDMINWEAHSLAFRRLSRQQKISIAKIVHQLINANKQNHIYYNDSPLCPCCNLDDKTFLHVFSCPDKSATSHRTLAQKQLIFALKNIGTPQQIVDAMEHGFRHWINPTQPVRSPTAGRLGAVAALLTTAFHEQFYDIGWLHLQLGRVSLHWTKAYWELSPGSTASSANLWTSSMIYLLWNYAKSIWTYRNEVVHVNTSTQIETYRWNRLRETVTEYYTMFSGNPSFLLPRHHYLFTDRTLEQRLKHTYDHLSCWVRSVTEARQVLLHHDIRLRSSLFPSSNELSSYTPTTSSTESTQTSLTVSTSTLSTKDHLTEDDASNISSTDSTSDSTIQSSSTLSDNSSCPTIITWSTIAS
jgi:ribonuclease HI